VARRDAGGAPRAPYGYVGGGPPSLEGGGYPPGVLLETFPFPLPLPPPELSARSLFSSHQISQSFT